MTDFLNKVVRAFSKSEVLLSILIIGATLAITLPTWLKNSEIQLWKDYRKTFYENISKTIPLVEPLNDYEDAQSFITGGLIKTFKINYVCSYDKLKDCNIGGEKFERSNGTHTVFPASWEDLGYNLFAEDFYGYENSDSSMVAGFKTEDGMSAILFYNPVCAPAGYETPASISSVVDGVQMLDHVCFNLIYDFNMTAPPNVVGKDIGFLTVFYPTSSKLASPIPSANMTAVTEADTCDAGYRIPNRFEAAAMALNHSLISDATYYDYLTATKAASTKAVYVYKQARSNDLSAYTTTVMAGNTRCVKR